MSPLTKALAVLLLSAGAGVAALTVGETPSAVVLQGADGGRLDGTPWKSSELSGKVFVLFYVDPDEKDLNEHAADAIKAKKYADDRFASVAVINLAATWTPDWLLDRLLASKQKKFARTVYVRDVNRTLVRKWGVADDSYAIAVFAPDGTVAFYKAGRLSDQDVKAMLEVIDRYAATSAAP